MPSALESSLSGAVSCSQAIKVQSHILTDTLLRALSALGNTEDGHMQSLPRFEGSGNHALYRRRARDRGRNDGGVEESYGLVGRISAPTVVSHNTVVAASPAQDKHKAGALDSALVVISAVRPGLWHVVRAAPRG